MNKALLTLLALSTTCFAGSTKPFKVAWTPYPSWQVIPASTLNISGTGSDLARRTSETGTNVEVIKYKEYVVSITALISGDVDACTMTLQEALSFPTDSGIPVTIVAVNDYSNGNDVIFGPKGSKLEDMVGKPVLLEEFSVSQYLLHRALKEKNIDPKRVKVRNTPGDEVPKVLLTSQQVPYAITWNPHVSRIQDSNKAETLYTSKQIPGQIVDAIVVRTDRIKGNEKAIQALVTSYFDTLGRWKRGTDERTTRAIASTADLKSKAEVELFKKTVDTTAFYWTPVDMSKFMKSQEIQHSIHEVRAALIDFGAFKGTNPEKYELTIDTQWVDAVK